MLTQSEAPAPMALRGTSSKLAQLLRKRLRQLMRVTLVLAIGLALAASALAVWWLTSLNGLPNIGDPFDAAALRALRIPDDQNAFIFLRQAVILVTPWPELPRAVALSAATIAWSEAGPKLQALVAANRQAIELFRQGAEQADAAPAGPSTDVRNIGLSMLALLEGSKRQESGDTPGAWGCYRAVLRMAAHVCERGTLDQRHCSNVIVLAGGWLQKRVATWAADPKTTIPQLQRALDDVLEIEPMPDADSFAVKMGYLEIMRSLERPIHPRDQQEIEGEWIVRLGDMQLSTEIIDFIEAARRFLMREPERSRRVVRLLCANWLAHLQTPEQRARKPAVRAVLTAKRPMTLLFYPVSPDAPAGARVLPPREIARWLVTAHDAKLRILWEKPWPPNRQPYVRTHRELVIILATEIYHRERGSLPPSEEALVGTYLKRLPDDSSAAIADETTPTVE